MSTPPASGRTPLAAPGGLTLLLLCIALLVSVSIGHSADRDRITVRVLIPRTTSALPFLLLARDHPVAGVDFQVDTFLDHAQALAMLLRGEVDLLESGTSQGWQNRLDGSPILMVDTGVWALSSLVGRDPSIRSFADLRGRKLALPFPGAPLDFQTRAILSHENMDADRDLTISYGPFAQSVSRLLAGQIDAAALPEPVATMAVRKNGLVRLLDYADAWAQAAGGDGKSPQVSLFATEHFAESHRALVSTVVSAWREASRQAAAHPSEVAARFAAALDLEPGILAEAARRTAFEVPDYRENRSRVESYYRAVSPFIPGGAPALDGRFFFAP